MKFSIKAIALAAALAIPSVSQAQFDTDVPLTTKGLVYDTYGTGFPDAGKAGGFIADFTIDFPERPNVTFNNYLVWCIDADRIVSPAGGPYTYWAFTAQGFADHPSYGGANGHNVTSSDMEKIVGLVDDLERNWSSYSIQDREDRQGSIWSIFRGETPVLTSIPTRGLDSWYVLFNDRNQTLLTRVVPEPGSAPLALLALAGFGMMVIIRRRIA